LPLKERERNRIEDCVVDLWFLGWNGNWGLLKRTEKISNRFVCVVDRTVSIVLPPDTLTVDYTTPYYSVTNVASSYLISPLLICLFFILIN
jgi:hypothetical protein